MKFVILIIPFRVLKNRSLFIIFSCIVHFKYYTLWFFNYLFKIIIYVICADPGGLAV